MYITYDRFQWSVYQIEGTVDKRPFSNANLPASEVPEFKPTWLVRVCDMQRVPGSDVNGHYWALSYSWNQSGEVIDKGNDEYERIDEGKHQIINTRSDSAEDGDLSTDQATDIQFVTFEELIQQVCTDFGIQYIWYDQICIDQDDHEAKVSEIQQMHCIYQNALATLVLVPELEFIGKDTNGYNMSNIDVILDSQWSKRMWTLEEMYMSGQLLFIGRNVHFWPVDMFLSFTLPKNGVVKFIRSSDQKDWMTCTALQYARSRTSSKAHDRIFALLNIFPELKDNITISYKQPLPDLMFQFYHLLAQKDSSILFFGAPIHRDDGMVARRQQEARVLPSWTGALGAHINEQAFTFINVVQVLEQYIIDGGFMRLTSAFIPVHIEAAAAIGRVGSSKGERNNGCCTNDGLPCELYQRSAGVYPNLKYGDQQTSLAFVAITNKSQADWKDYTQDLGLQATHLLPTSDSGEAVVNSLRDAKHTSGFLSLIEECSECFIMTNLWNLIGLADTSFYCYPVVTKFKDHYKSVGICLLLETLYTVDIENGAQEFTIA